MKSIIRSGIVTIAFLSQIGNAAPIIYEEAINGDLSDQTTTTFNFDVGINTITGSIHNLTLYDTNGNFLGYDSDWDAFLFSIPENTVVPSVNVLTSFLNSTGNTSFVNIQWVLTSSLSSTRIDQSLITPAIGFLPPSGGTLWGDLLPLTADVIPFSNGASYSVTTPGASGWGQINPNQSSGGEVSYTLSFTVAPVPEPTSIILFGSSLMGLMWTRKMNRARWAAQRPRHQR